MGNRCLEFLTYSSYHQLHSRGVFCCTRRQTSFCVSGRVGVRVCECTCRGRAGGWGVLLVGWFLQLLFTVALLYTHLYRLHTRVGYTY